MSPLGIQLVGRDGMSHEEAFTLILIHDFAGHLDDDLKTSDRASITRPQSWPLGPGKCSLAECMQLKRIHHDPELKRNAYRDDSAAHKI